MGLFCLCWERRAEETQGGDFSMPGGGSCTPVKKNPAHCFIFSKSEILYLVGIQ